MWWWIVLGVIAFVAVAPISVLFVIDKYEPLDIVNDPGGRMFAAMLFALVWLVGGAVVAVGWIVYGMLLLAGIV